MSWTISKTLVEDCASSLSSPEAGEASSEDRSAVSSACARLKSTPIAKL